MVVQYRNLREEELCRALFAQFIRHQEVRDCWRRVYNVLKGFASVEAELSCPEQSYLDLSSIHISEDMRGKGIGRGLFQAAKQWAKDHGARKLYISAHSAVESQAFYKAMGCVEAKVYHQRHVEIEPYDCQLECDLEAADQNVFNGTFEKLLQKAEELVKSDPSIQQVVAVMTSGNQIFCCINHNIIEGNYADETAFVNMLAKNEDTEIRYSVCMWSDSTLDIPSWNLRDLLVQLNPSNVKAKFLLRGGEGFKVRALEDMYGI